MNPSLTTADVKHITPIVTGLNKPGTEAPLVAIIQEDGEDHYKVFIHLYLADGITPLLNDDLNEVTHLETDAGNILTRIINISYEPPVHPHRSYTLWEIIFCYEATPPMAQAIYVSVHHEGPSNPATARGTVTTVTYS